MAILNMQATELHPITIQLFTPPSGAKRIDLGDARTEVSIVDTESGADITLPALPEGDLRSVRFSRDEGHVALIVNADVKDLRFERKCCRNHVTTIRSTDDSDFVGLDPVE